MTSVLWEGPVNRALAARTGDYDNALLIDWYRESAGHPEYFADDGVHLTASGQEIFASMIATQIVLQQRRWATTAGCTV